MLGPRAEANKLQWRVTFKEDMEKEISKNSFQLKVQENELYVSSWLIAQKLDVNHKHVKALMKRHKIGQNDLVVVDHTVHNSMFKKAEGRQAQEVFLNEYDASRLILRMRSSEKVDKFKDELTNEFISQRRAIENMRRALWNSGNDPEREKIRQEGIKVRLGQTDAIKIFTEYATSQGSTSAHMYYLNLTKMENKALFHLELITFEYDNFRDIVSGFGLSTLQVADRIIAKALCEGMKMKMYYKDIYKLAKARVETYADLFGKIDIHAIGCEGVISIC